jgi:hypothetical protein
MSKGESLEKRFWSKVDIKSKDECWLWKARITILGYGQFKYNGTMKQAHRVAWELTHGEIKDGAIIRHTCDIRPCCNPHHLKDGTQADNIQDMMTKGRNKSGHVIGIKNGNHKLNENDVLEIRHKLQLGYTQKWLASQYDVKPQTISLIYNRKIWSHI